MVSWLWVHQGNKVMPQSALSPSPVKRSLPLQEPKGSRLLFQVTLRGPFESTFHQIPAMLNGYSYYLCWESLLTNKTWISSLYFVVLALSTREVRGQKSCVKLLCRETYLASFLLTIWVAGVSRRVCLGVHKHFVSFTWCTLMFCKHLIAWTFSFNVARGFQSVSQATGKFFQWRLDW